jgi:hypothetical protein
MRIVLNRWKNFFNQVLNVHGVHDVKQMDIHMAEPLVPEPKLVEVEIDIGKLKSYKAPGNDQILAKLIEAGVKHYVLRYTNLFVLYGTRRNCHIKKIYKIVILPVVLYGCRAWSLTLREEHRLRVLENRVLRRIFGPKNEEDRLWRKLHSDELHSLYSSPNVVRVIKSRRMRWTGHVACMGEGRGVYKILVGRPKGKRPLGRPRYMWEDSIRMDLREIEIDELN